MEPLNVTITPLADRASHVSSKFSGPSAPSIITEGLGAASEASFADLLVDIVNPLQHIPIVGHLYRAISGDEIEPASQVAGGVLFGGPIGGLISLASAVFGALFDSSAEATPTTLAEAPLKPDIFKS